MVLTGSTAIRASVSKRRTTVSVSACLCVCVRVCVCVCVCFPVTFSAFMRVRVKKREPVCIFNTQK